MGVKQMKLDEYLATLPPDQYVQIGAATAWLYFGKVKDFDDSDMSEYYRKRLSSTLSYAKSALTNLRCHPMTDKEALSLLAKRPTTYSKKEKPSLLERKAKELDEDYWYADGYTLTYLMSEWVEDQIAKAKKRYKKAIKRRIIQVEVLTDKNKNFIPIDRREVKEHYPLIEIQDVGLKSGIGIVIDGLESSDWWFESEYLKDGGNAWFGLQL